MAIYKIAFCKLMRRQVIQLAKVGISGRSMTSAIRTFAKVALIHSDGFGIPV